MRLYLLRHGEVASHRGDVPITDQAVAEAYRVGQWIARHEPHPVRVLSGETRRAMETADHLARALIDDGRQVIGPTVAFALRNPDLYLNGVRVNMVSSAETLAEQVAGLVPRDVADVEFFPDFFASPDRIGWWMEHESPPGEDADALAARMRGFMRSLTDPTPLKSEVVIAVTHSPLLRAVGRDFLGHDIGEPPWVSGLVVTMSEGPDISVELFTTGAG